MNFAKLVVSLERFGNALPSVLVGIDADDACWQPEDHAWSLVEIVAHLVDEETRDFRPRVASTLADPNVAWASIDPEGWARLEAYRDRDLATQLEQFVHVRRESVKWLRGLVHPDWDQAYEHPRFGSIRAGDLLAAWVAHDALHLRQIAKRMYQLAEHAAAEYGTGYGGEWKA